MSVGAAPRTWHPLDVPKCPGEGSRFSVATSPLGWELGSSKVLPLVYAGLLDNRANEMESLRPEPIHVSLKSVVQRGSDYCLVDRAVVTAVPSLKSIRPGRVWRKAEGGELLDECFLGLSAWKLAPDAEIWASLLSVARADGLTGRALREVSDNVALLVLCRAGCLLDRADLPAYPVGV